MVGESGVNWLNNPSRVRDLCPGSGLRVDACPPGGAPVCADTLPGLRAANRGPTGRCCRFSPSASYHHGLATVNSPRCMKPVRPTSS